MSLETTFNTYHFLAIEHETSIDEIDRLVGCNVQQIDKILENGVIKRKANKY